MARYHGRHVRSRRHTPIGAPATAQPRSLQRIGVVGAVGLLGAAASVTAAALPGAAATDRARWLLDETVGTIAFDATGNGNNGTAENTVGDGTGYFFNGVNSRVVVPSSESLNPGTAAFSFSVTFSTSVALPAGGDYDLLRKGLASTKGGEYKVEVIQANGKGRALCLVKDAAKKVASIRGTTNLTDGKTHTITCSKTSTGVTMYVDALAPVTKTVPSLGSISNTASLVLGAKAEGGDWFNGYLGEASVTAQ
ncbi:MAG: LamG-like jellyroll fold domain-containing protein [Nocardioidaceae bacterium]